MALTNKDLEDLEAKLDEYGELGHGMEQMLIDEVRRLQRMIKIVGTPVEPGTDYTGMVYRMCKKEACGFQGES